MVAGGNREAEGDDVTDTSAQNPPSLPLTGHVPPSQLERLSHAQKAPMVAKRAQRPADCGLFDLNARAQWKLDL
jgi:hypothetical protein